MLDLQNAVKSRKLGATRVARQGGTRNRVQLSPGNNFYVYCVFGLLSFACQCPGTFKENLEFCLVQQAVVELNRAELSMGLELIGASWSAAQVLSLDLITCHLHQNL